MNSTTTVNAVHQTAASKSKLRGFELFPVPVLIFTWPQAARYRAEMIAGVEARRSASAGIKVSNVDGWHSKTDMPEWEETAFAKFCAWAAAAASLATAKWQSPEDPDQLIEHWRMNGWANVNPPGGARNSSHHHINRDWNWSASYYLKLPHFADGSPAGGRIVLEEKFVGIARVENGLPRRRTLAHQPLEGEMVMFPSWLYHSVEPHNGISDRISIAMNFASSELERSRFWTHRRSYMWRKYPGLMRPLAKLRGRWDQTLGALPPGYDITADTAYLDI